MSASSAKNEDRVERKIISISSKRQVTIPQKYFEKLGFHGEAECILQNNAIIIRPVRTGDGGAFSEEILADLIAQGLSGQELLDQFKEQSRKIRPAVERLIEEADEVAKSSSVGMKDIFAVED